MLNRILLTLLFWMPVSAAMAEPASPARVIDNEDLMVAIYAHDYDRVEEILAQTQAMVAAGTASHNDMRRKFEPFSTTNPKTVEFVRAWSRRQPYSAYKDLALAFVDQSVGWSIRGNLINSKTYPEALIQSGPLLQEARLRAQNAYAHDKSLAPASDAVFFMARSIHSREYALQVLDEVMTTRPDWETLRQGLNIANPSFGGTVELGLAICEYYGPMLSEPSDDMVRYCKLSLGLAYYGGVLKEDIAAWLDAEDEGLWQYYRVRNLLYQDFSVPLTPAQVSQAERYFRDSNITDYDLARQYDMRIAVKYKLAPMEYVVLDRAKLRAKQILRHHPYNVWALNTLSRLSFDSRLTEDGGIRNTPNGNSPTNEQQLDYARRQVLASPYNAEFWLQYARRLEFGADANSDSSKTFFGGEEARINAIVYSNHSLGQLRGYFKHKMGQYDRLSRPQEFAEYQVWADLRDATDLDAQVICPLIRADILIQAVSEAMGIQYAKGRSAVVSLSLERLVREVRQNNRCPGILDTPAEDLVFEAIAVDLGELPTGG